MKTRRLFGNGPGTKQLLSVRRSVRSEKLRSVITELPRSLLLEPHTQRPRARGDAGPIADSTADTRRAHLHQIMSRRRSVPRTTEDSR